MTERGEPTATQPTEPTAAGAAAVPARTPGETAPPDARRRLDEAPSERFADGRDAGGPVAAGSVAADGSVDAGSPIRAVAMGIVGAAVGSIIFVVLAVGFSFSAGLLVVAIFTGRFTGLFVRAGAAGSMSSAARVALSVVIFLVALTVATLVTWLAAGFQGGVLSIADYLDQAYGTPLISLEFMLGTLMAWWSAR